MEVLRFDLSEKSGIFKPMNAVNNGPCHKRHAVGQTRSNLESYKKARIPYARSHDTSEWVGYGGEHVIDITAIFPNFDADPYNADSYDFAVTDEYILITLDAGTQTFYRLGQKIEHFVKKYGTVPPKDFKKWAVICEHIIRHYNEGFANGFNLNIEYWEIWNEPDLDADDSKDKCTWGGTKAQFFDFYETAAKHLKKCFPNLKIGGPAIASKLVWAEEFIVEMAKRKAPLDFFSWHIYCTEPKKMLKRAEDVRKMLDENGFDNAESILNEWNYVADWRDKFIESIKTITGMKGAAFVMACMTEAQKSSIDMLMYYDAKPHFFNGIFDFYTLKELKGYYSLYWYGKFYDMKSEVRCKNSIDNIYTLCGVDENDKVLSVITYYADEDDGCPPKTFAVDFGKEAEYEIYLLDEEHDAQLIATTKDLSFTMEVNSCIMIKEN